MELSESIVFAGGRMCRYDEAKVGLLSHGLNYGTGCFEGIRGYWSPADRELYLLQLREHYERLHSSAKILLMKLPHSVDELIELTVELCVRNRYEENIYIRPLIYKAAEDVGVRLWGVPDAFAIAALPFNKYFDAEAGLRACVSSWRRIDDTVAPARAKITGSYVNSALAKSEAQMNGFDEAILLSQDGHVAEGSAANLFLVKNGTLFTPDPAQNVLEGITRRTVLGLAKTELDIAVAERALDRSELYAADELFLTGTAAGVTYINSVDHRAIGNGTMGPIARALSKLFNEVTLGRNERYRSLVTATYADRKVGAA
ncbi:MAG: branched-chain amino acid transaminase [Candidatus Eremiobacteraeota bacterium]|nr:branched-chain amino acid transaminase [Candidatus Eremiobacteraeota bacterium]